MCHLRFFASQRRHSTAAPAAAESQQSKKQCVQKDQKDDSEVQSKKQCVQKDDSEVRVTLSPLLLLLLLFVSYG